MVLPLVQKVQYNSRTLHEYSPSSIDSGKQPRMILRRLFSSSYFIFYVINLVSKVTIVCLQMIPHDCSLSLLLRQLTACSVG